MFSCCSGLSTKSELNSWDVMYILALSIQGVNRILRQQEVIQLGQQDVLCCFDVLASFIYTTNNITQIAIKHTFLYSKTLVLLLSFA